MKKRVADIIMDVLVEQGITDCFAVVGGGAMHLNNALALNQQIRKVFNHHEQACTMAAEAYARLKGKMAAVCVTSGPGATNTLTGILGAWQDSIPLLVISGNVRYEISKENIGLPLRYRGVQEFDIINSIQNMTKYSVVIKNPLTIKKEVLKAIKIAMSGRRGPVWIDVPLDMQNAMVEESELLEDDYRICLPKPSKKTLEDAFDMLSNAKRPCMIAGSGIVSSHTQDQLEIFVNKVKIPVLGGAWVADVFYHEHPRYYGLSGNVGPRVGNFILQNADVILTLGSSLSFNQTGYNLDAFAPNAKIIMVDVEENEYLKIKSKVSLFIHSDLNNFFHACNGVSTEINMNKKWLDYCESLKTKFDRYEAIKTLHMEDRVNKYYFWKIFDELAPDDMILALGNSSCNGAKLQVGKKYKEQRLLTNYMCGSMGYDLPAAIGAAVAAQKPVLCITGDGSFMMNLQELQTIKHYHLPIKIIVFENEGYNAIKQTCKNFFNGIEIGCSPDTGVSFPKFEKIAFAFGYHYACCNTNSELVKSFEWLLNQEEHALLEIKQMLDDPMIPKVMSRLDKHGIMKSPALQDMYPFIDDKEYDELMIQV